MHQQLVPRDAQQVGPERNAFGHLLAGLDRGHECGLNEVRKRRRIHPALEEPSDRVKVAAHETTACLFVPVPPGLEQDLVGPFVRTHVTPSLRQSATAWARNQAAAAFAGVSAPIERNNARASRASAIARGMSSSISSFASSNFASAS